MFKFIFQATQSYYAPIFHSTIAHFASRIRVHVLVLAFLRRAGAGGSRTGKRTNPLSTNKYRLLNGFRKLLPVFGNSIGYHFFTETYHCIQIHLQRTNIGYSMVFENCYQFSEILSVNIFFTQTNYCFKPHVLTIVFGN